MAILFKQITIIGVGLIGGSLALAAKKAGRVETLVGYGKKRGDLYKAVSMGVLDRYFLTLPKAVEGADLVVLATPVGIMEPMANAIAPHLKKDAIVTDVGSVKGKMVSRIETILSNRAFFVGGHPMAGGEKSGVQAAIPSLFEKSVTLLTPTEKTNRKALKDVATLWKAVGASVTEIDPMAHDQAVAAVSHLPHLVAYALMELFSHPRMAKSDPLPFAAGSLRDFTRVADSSPELWRDIFLLNKMALVEMVDLYQETLEKLKKAILNGQNDEILKILNRAKTIRQRVRP